MRHFLIGKNLTQIISQNVYLNAWGIKINKETDKTEERQDKLLGSKEVLKVTITAATVLHNRRETSHKINIAMNLDAV